MSLSSDNIQIQYILKNGNLYAQVKIANCEVETIRLIVDAQRSLPRGTDSKVIEYAIDESPPFRRENLKFNAYRTGDMNLFGKNTDDFYRVVEDNVPISLFSKYNSCLVKGADFIPPADTEFIVAPLPEKLDKYYLVGYDDIVSYESNILPLVESAIRKRFNLALFHSDVEELPSEKLDNGHQSLTFGELMDVSKFNPNPGVIATTIYKMLANITQRKGHILMKNEYGVLVEHDLANYEPFIDKVDEILKTKYSDNNMRIDECFYTLKNSRNVSHTESVVLQIKDPRGRRFSLVDRLCEQ